MRCAMYKVGLAKCFLEKIGGQIFFWILHLGSNIDVPMFNVPMFQCPMFKPTHPIMKLRPFYRNCVDYTIGCDLCGNIRSFDIQCLIPNVKSKKTSGIQTFPKCFSPGPTLNIAHIMFPQCF